MEIINLGWPWRSLMTSTVGYLIDSWASCLRNFGNWLQGFNSQEIFSGKCVKFNVRLHGALRIILFHCTLGLECLGLKWHLAEANCYSVFSCSKKSLNFNCFGDTKNVKKWRMVGLFGGATNFFEYVYTASNRIENGLCLCDLRRSRSPNRWNLISFYHQS